MKINNVTIEELLKMYHMRKMTPTDFINQTFDTIERFNPKLNAFISTFKNDAKRSAVESTKRFEQNKSIRPLEGIPFSAKDMYYTKGKLTTCGSLILKDFIPDEDADLIQIVEQQGAILIGKTNQNEFANGITNEFYGDTANPYDYDNTAGGSSGGSAASIAVNAGMFSLGTDTGGSIRIPAAYCGVYGFKPSYGCLSMKGIFPLAPTLDHAGIITKNMSDMLYVYNRIRNGNKQEVENCVIPDNDPTRRKWKIGVLENPEGNEEIINKYYEYINYLAKNDLDIIIVKVPLFEQFINSFDNLLFPEASKIHSKWLPLEELYAKGTYQQLKAGLNISAVDYLNALEHRDNLKKTMDELFDQVDIIVTPSSYHSATKCLTLADINNTMKYTALYNITGNPAISIMAGFTSKKMPVGVQLVGNYGCDNDLLIFARKYEE